MSNTKVKVEITGAYVDGHGPGSTVEVNEGTANHLIAVGYGKKVEEVKAEVKEAEPTEPASESKPKRKRSKKKTESSDSDDS